MALDLCGLEGPEVDIALGGVEPMVDDWESGTLVPSFAQIEALAELTNLMVGFFYLPEVKPIVGGFICRRGRGGSCEPLGIPVEVTLPESMNDGGLVIMFPGAHR